MKLKHPVSGAFYTLMPDGNVKVEDSEGRTGIFGHGARYLRGEIREADPHLVGWIQSPDMANRRTGTTNQTAGGGAGEAAQARPVGVAIPTLGRSARDNQTHEQERRHDMDLGLTGKKALVSAATRGIGLEIARTLADEGCDVAICARGESGIESAVKDLEGRGAKVFARAVDVAVSDDYKQFIDDAAKALSGLDIYISNASSGGGPGEKAWQANFDVDVMGAVHGVNAALPALTASDAGSVVFISSTAALEYLGVPQAYNAMKAALIAHAGDLSQALAPQGVRVNVVSPGPVYFEGGSWEMIKQAMPDMYNGALAQCAIGRMGAPEEVARAVVFLASPAASLITGANLVCDGGFTKRMPF